MSRLCFAIASLFIFSLFSGCLQIALIGPSGGTSTSPLVLSASTNSVTSPGQSVALSVSGGLPPYQYGFLTGGGVINNTALPTVISGWFATSEVQVTDSLGNAAAVSINQTPSGLAWGGNGSDQAAGIATTPDGGTVIFGNTTSTVLPDGLSATGGVNSVFLVKFSSTGAKVFDKVFSTGSGDYAQGNSVGVDAQGNIYFVGTTAGSFPGFTNPGGGWSGFDIFVGKVGPSGNTLWLKQLTVSGDDTAYSMVVDPTSGTSTFVGWNMSTFPGSPNPYVGFQNSYIAQMDTNGNLNGKAYEFGNTSSNLSSGITVDNLGNFYVSGATTGAVPGYTNGSAFNCGEITKFNSSLSLQWQIQLPCTAASQPVNLVADAIGNLYFGGFASGAVFGTLQGTKDLIFGKIDASNGSLDWGKQMGMSGGDESAYWTKSMNVLSDGSFLMEAGTTSAWPGFTNKGGTDAYIFHLDTNGEVLWQKQLASAAGDAVIFTTDSRGYIYLAVTSATASSFLGVTAPYPSSGDVFLFKLDSSGNEQ